MSREAVVYIRMSEAMQEFMVAALDLLEEVEHADRALITDEVLEAAEHLRNVIADYQGEL